MRKVKRFFRENATKPMMFKGDSEYTNNYQILKRKKCQYPLSPSILTTVLTDILASPNKWMARAWAALALVFVANMLSWHGTTTAPSPVYLPSVNKFVHVPISNTLSEFADLFLFLLCAQRRHSFCVNEIMFTSKTPLHEQLWRSAAAFFFAISFLQMLAVRECAAAPHSSNCTLSDN